jgi:prepilin peptidase CpaA
VNDGVTCVKSRSSRSIARISEINMDSINMSPVVVIVTALIVGGAAFYDVRSRRIPNELILSGLVSGLALNVWALGWSGGLGWSVLGFGVGFLLFLPGYLLRFTGGGDVKLLATVGSLIGPVMLLYAFAMSVLAGIAIAVAQSVFFGVRQGAISPISRYAAMLSTTVATRRPVYIRPTKDELFGRKLPLAPAIALGTLAAIWIHW